MSIPSEGERIFQTYWRVFEGPEPEIEHRFHPTRRWRFDFAWPQAMCAVEIDGGTFTEGRHTRPQGFRDDLEKLNAASALGWTVYRFTPQMMTEDPFILQQVIDQIIGDTT